VSRRLFLTLIASAAFALTASSLSQTTSCTCSSRPATPQPSAPPPQGSPADPGHKKNPVHPPPPVSVNVNLSTADDTKDSCNAGKEQTKLGAARFEEDGGRLDKAGEKYDHLLDSCDLATRKVATERSKIIRSQLNSWWWQFGDPHPIFRWIPLYPARCLYVILILTALLLLSRILFLWFRVAIILIFKRPFDGKATIISPTDLSKDAPVALFAASLATNARLARELLSGDRRHFQVRSINLLSVPSGLATSTFANLPEVKGVNLGGTFQALFNLARYFTWRVETDLVYFPPPDDNADPARMAATSTLRWAWTSEPPITVACNVKNAQDVDELAFAIAARLLGRSYFVTS
jgi:hypothetical protein